MKICLYTQVSELLSKKKSLIEAINNLIIRDAKHKMWETLPVDNILGELKKSGVDGLELIFPAQYTDEEIEKIKKLINRHQLDIYSIHQSNDNTFDIGLSDLEKLCILANNFSAEAITVHVDALKKKIFDQEFVSKLKKLEKKYDIKFGIENMPKSPFNLNLTFAYRETEYSSAVTKAGLSMTLDTTHLAQMGGDICDFYLKHKDRIVDIHLGDYRKDWINQKLLLTKNTHLPLGKGELPIIKFLKLLKKNDYQGVITMEIHADLRGLCESASLIKKALG